jgi:hypothetical protein
MLPNEANNQPISVIYGIITSGTAWRFMKLTQQTVTIELTDYPLPSVDLILGILAWMISSNTSTKELIS